MFGDYLANLMEIQGLTMDELALKSGVSQSYLSMLKNGQRKPSAKIIEKLSKTLGHYDYLMISAGYYTPKASEIWYELANFIITEISDTPHDDALDKISKELGINSSEIDNLLSDLEVDEDLLELPIDIQTTIIQRYLSNINYSENRKILFEHDYLKEVSPIQEDERIKALLRVADDLTEEEKDTLIGEVTSYFEYLKKKHREVGNDN